MVSKQESQAFRRIKNRLESPKRFEELSEPQQVKLQEQLQEIDKEETGFEHELNENYGTEMTVYTTQKGKKIHMPRIWTPANLSNNIFNHNKVNSVTNVVVVGKTGTGKTVLTKRLIHDLHQKHPSYIIKWLSSDDIFHVKEILQKLTKHRDYILIWDDISFLDQKMGKEEIADLGHTLAVLRHEYLGEDSHLINFSLIHYLKSINKGSGLRQGDFVIATSLTQNEKSNFAEVFDGSALRNFGRMYRKANLRGSFDYTTMAGSKTYYSTQDVRVVLVNEINHSHLALIDKIDCDYCGLDKYSQKKETILTPSEFVDKLGYSLQHLGHTMRWFSFIKDGNLKILKPNERVYWRHIAKLAQYIPFEPSEIVDEIESRKKNKAKVRKNFNDDDKEAFKFVESISKKVLKKNGLIDLETTSDDDVNSAEKNNI